MTVRTVSAHRISTVRSRAVGISGCVTGAVKGAVMRDSSRVTADMIFDMISPTCLMIVCRLHRAARPCSRFCLHGCMSKQRASARVAARTGAERSPLAAAQRVGSGDVSGVKPAAAEPVGGAPRLVRNGWTDGESHVRRGGDSAGETACRVPNGFSLATRAGRGGGASLPFRSGVGCAARHAFTFDCASSHAQNCATSGSPAGARGAIHQ